MRIVLLTMGSRGDIEPYVALGERLRADGHSVAVATHDNFKELIESRGLEHRHLEGDPREVLEKEEGHRWLETGKRMNPVVFMKRMMDAAKDLMPRMLDDAVNACRDSDLIITHGLTGLAAGSIGEKFGIKVLPAYLQHVHPTRIYPSPMATPMPKLGRLYNRFTYILASQGYWQLMRKGVNNWRTKSLGLKPFPFSGPFTKEADLSYQFLYAFSPSVVPRAPDWGDNIHVCGYWFLEKKSEWNPPSDLLHFLAAGDPPVFVGFSSMTNRDPMAVTRIIIEALKLSGQRGIIATGWGGLSQSEFPETIYRIDSAPFDWLFPRMAAVVHHGGAGTTATGLRAGVPSIVVPFFADQFFWGWRVSELGVGPKSIPRQKLTSERLAAAIKSALLDDGIRRRASALGEKIRGEDGIGRAADFIRRNCT